MKRLLFLMLLFALPAFGQGSRFGDHRPMLQCRRPAAPSTRFRMRQSTGAIPQRMAYLARTRPRHIRTSRSRTPCSTATQVTLAGTPSLRCNYRPIWKLGSLGCGRNLCIHDHDSERKQHRPLHACQQSARGGGGSLIPSNNTWTGINNFTGGININGIPGLQSLAV